MYRIYTIEAVAADANESVIHKFKKKHRHHPNIGGAVLGYQPFVCRRGQQFLSQVSEFCDWQASIRLKPEECIILWLSVHGDSETRTAVSFEDGETSDYLELLGRLSGRLQTRVVILQSICYGALPGVTRVMNNCSHGPMLILGPTIEVDVPALHYAERETLKLLASAPTPTQSELHEHIDGINDWGSVNHPGHDNFYRAWYWDDSANRLLSHPAAGASSSVRSIKSAPEKPSRHS